MLGELLLGKRENSAEQAIEVILGRCGGLITPRGHGPNHGTTNVGSTSNRPHLPLGSPRDLLRQMAIRWHAGASPPGRAVHRGG